MGGEGRGHLPASGRSVEPVRFGISVPNFGVFGDPGALVAAAEAADAAGWDGFFVWDHIVIADGVPVADPWVALGAIARATDRVRFGPMVAAVPRHRPWVLARQCVSLDRLGGGRFVLGVGIGYPPDVEFGTFGEPVGDRTRADMLDEALVVMEGVWSGEPFAFRGEHYEVAETRFAPPPVQRPRFPIWVAAMLPNRRPLRRAARFDGVVPIRVDFRDVSPAEVRDMVAYLRDHGAPAEGYDVVLAGAPLAAEAYDALAEAGVTWYLGGPGEGEVLEDTLTWIGAGPGDYVA